jgi:hypothetical protein
MPSFWQRPGSEAGSLWHGQHALAALAEADQQPGLPEEDA